MSTPAAIPKTAPIQFVDSAQKIRVVRVNESSVALVFQREVVDQEDAGFVLKDKNIASIVVPVAALERALDLLKAPPASAAVPEVENQEAQAA
ncbi:hypothetical protein [Kerstersia gyiorum]|uniref:Uncharacterized protein n=1 Tax=Kerstersia gyiorum TaxID=206506 RepID=A0A171KSE5_9BURK|nr:hypothetical protein [Kerstersia gyiorum]KKO71812.1 hypothetical protein AAV32_09555 [Kerstersia gyiorum]